MYRHKKVINGVSLLLPLYYLAEIGVSALSPSYATPSLGYEIKELENLSSSDDSGNDDALSANTTMGLLPNTSTIVYETETLVTPSIVKTFVIYMANEFHENWPEDSHKQKCLYNSNELDSIKWNEYRISYG